VSLFRTRRGVGLFLLLSFLSTPLAECGVALRFLRPVKFTIGRSCQPNEEEMNIDPQADAVRRAWLKKFGDKWGLSESSEAEVVCTCTCCGDRCPMGAACCCLAPKYPVVDGASFWFRGPGCRIDQQEIPIPPASLSWTFLLVPTTFAHAESTLAFFSSNAHESPDWESIPDSPPPEFSSIRTF
jgi:hypothetical protein